MTERERISRVIEPDYWNEKIKFQSGLKEIYQDVALQKADRLIAAGSYG